MKKKLLISAFALVLYAGGARAAVNLTQEDGVYQIATPSDLVIFANLVNDGNQPNACAKVTSDLDMSDSGFEPIGTKDYPYTGTFDGDGHTIKLAIKNATSDYQGLFGYVGCCTIQNVTVEGSVTGQNHVGGIVGMINSATEGTTTISNCTNNATVSGVHNTNSASDLKNGRNVGGIIGIVNGETTMSNVVISGCTNTGSVTSQGSTGHCGGIVGYSGYITTITGCTNSGSVTGVVEVGGIIGSKFTDEKKRTDGVTNTALNISRCYNSGTVTATDGEAGGWIGFLASSSTNIRYSANSGSVTGGSRIGSLVGTASSYISIGACYNTYSPESGNLPIYGACTTKMSYTRYYDINWTQDDDSIKTFNSTEIADGTLCYNLNDGAKSTECWYQKLTGEDADPSPVLTALADEANVVNKGTLKEYGSTGDGSDVYFNSKTLVENSKAEKFYQLTIVGATTTAMSNLKSNCPATSKNILVQDGDAWYCGNAELVDKTAYNIGVDYTAGKFTYDRTLPAGISTFVLPIATSVSNVNGSVYKLSKYDGATLTFSDVTETLEPNTPYLVQVESEGSLLTGTLENVAVSAMTEKDVYEVTASSATHFGYYTKQSINTDSDTDNTYYAYTGGSFYKATGTWTINPFRTMLKISGGNGAKSLGVHFGGETSGIVSPSPESSTVDVYTASGVKVRSQADTATALKGLPTGLYIVGGKKVVKN